MRKRWMSQETSERGRSQRAPAGAPASGVVEAAAPPVAGGPVAAPAAAGWLWLSRMPGAAEHGPCAARGGRHP
jgi:hypothetical protein